MNAGLERLVRRWLLLLLISGVSLIASATAREGMPKQWDAQWMAAPDGPRRDYDVLYFRKVVSLRAVPGKFVVDVSADTRFELHVNGQRVGTGPAMGDVHHWRYETYDLAPYLKTGENMIAAMVWNFGSSAAVAQMSSETAFFLSAEERENSSINSGEGWQTRREKGRTLVRSDLHEYYAAGPGEAMDGRRMNWTWDRTGDGAGVGTSRRETSNQDGPDKDICDNDTANHWLPSRSLGHAAPPGARDSPTPWMLQKDELPAMRYTPVSAGRGVRLTGMSTASLTNLLEKPLTVPAHADVTLLLDRGVLVTAYPSLQINGGKDASIDLTYAEALYDAKGEKGDRNEIAGREIKGIRDHIDSDGEPRVYRTLWWRTWRYLQLEIKTTDTPLTIESVGAFYTAYPFEAVAHFESDDLELGRIWETGWRTAQLCAHETYMDTPYWEQLQYVGDTRIQALISYGVTGDDRLARQAMLAYRDSLLTDGLTQSRYPSSLTQVIPPFSLLWIGMLHDFWWYRNDPDFIRSLLPGTRGVLDWFSQRQRPDGLLGYIEWWPFVDWSPPLFEGGVPPQGVDGGSSALTLQFVEALQYAAQLESRFGESDRAIRYEELAKRASESLLRLNWDEKAGLLADTPERKSYSQQANALAVWLDVVPKGKQRAIMSKVLAASSRADALHAGASAAATQPMAEASYYFRFYVARAVVHAGLGDEYIPMLEPWRKMLRLGLSTWAETPEPTRSDSHAWSAHPTLDLLALVAGIAPGSPGFESVLITPHLSHLHDVTATMPTPKGLVQVHYGRDNRGWTAVINLPDQMRGELSWHGHQFTLHPGEQKIDLKE